MGMIRYKRPDIATGAGFGKERSQSSKKGTPVIVVTKDRSPLYAPDDDVMEHAGRIKTCLSRHKESYGKAGPSVKQNLIIL
jgi:hypothetical protein